MGTRPEQYLQPNTMVPYQPPQGVTYGSAFGPGDYTTQEQALAYQLGRPVIPPQPITGAPYQDQDIAVRQWPFAWQGIPPQVLRETIVEVLTADQMYPIEKVLPRKHYTGPPLIEMKTTYFNKHMADRIPEQGVPRVTTNRYWSFRKAIHRIAMGMEFEHGFLGTATGRLHLAWTLQQVTAACLKYMIADCYMEMLSQPNMPQTWNETHRIPFNDFAQVESKFQSEFEEWGILVKSYDGFSLLTNHVKETFASRDVQGPFTMIVPYGTKSLMRFTYPEKRAYDFEGPVGQRRIEGKSSIIEAQTEDVDVIEGQRYILEEGEPPVDPLVRTRYIGECFRMDEGHRGKHIPVNQRHITVHDNTHDKMATIFLRNAFDNCGLFYHKDSEEGDPRGTLTQAIGKDFFNPFHSVENYLAESGFDILLDDWDHFNVHGMLPMIGGGAGAPAPAGGGGGGPVGGGGAPAVRRRAIDPAARAAAAAAAIAATGGSTEEKREELEAEIARLTAMLDDPREDLTEEGRAEIETEIRRLRAELAKLPKKRKEKTAPRRRKGTGPERERKEEKEKEPNPDGSDSPVVPAREVPDDIEDDLDTGAHFVARISRHDDGPSYRRPQSSAKRQRVHVSENIASLLELAPNLDTFIRQIRTGDEDAYADMEAFDEFVGIWLRKFAEEPSQEQGFTFLRAFPEAIQVLLRIRDTAGGHAAFADHLEKLGECDTLPDMTHYIVHTLIPIEHGVRVANSFFDVPATQQMFYNFLCALLDAQDRPFPIYFWIFRPHMRYPSGAVIAIKPGEGTGVTLVGTPDLEWGADVARKMEFGHLHVNTGCVIYKPQNVVVIPNAIPRQCTGGGGVRFWDPLSDKDHRAYEQLSEDSEMKDLFSVAVAPHKSSYSISDKIYIDLTGYFGPGANVTEQPEDIHYRMASFYRAWWGWAASPNYPTDNRFFMKEDQPRFNTFMAQAHQLMPDENGRFCAFSYDGNGHWGSLPTYGGIRRDRAGVGHNRMVIDKTPMYNSLSVPIANRVGV